MTPATRLLVVISGCLVLLLAALFLVYPYLRADETETPQQAVTVNDPSELNPLPAANTTAVVDNTIVVEETPVERTESQQRAEAERLTRMFVERFGSYSNFSDFANITSLEPFMTASMKTYASGLKEKAQNDQTVGEYYGVTSQLISLNITKFDVSSSATVGFVIQQETQDGLQSQIQTQYRDGRLELVYRDNQWLVNGIFYN